MGDASEQTAVTVDVPVHWLGELKELLRGYPRLTYFRRGWIVARVAIVGPSEEMRCFLPKLREWQQECASRDAW